MTHQKTKQKAKPDFKKSQYKCPGKEHCSFPGLGAPAHGCGLGGLGCAEERELPRSLPYLLSFSCPPRAGVCISGQRAFCSHVAQIPQGLAWQGETQTECMGVMAWRLVISFRVFKIPHQCHIIDPQNILVKLIGNSCLYL